MLRIIFTTCLFAIYSLQINAQDLSGQWKGSFIDKSASYGSFSGDKCDYVLDLEINNGEVTGTSYTYFTEGGKRYYTICSITGKADMKSKYVEIQEINRTKTNIPSNVNNCFQVHKLKYSKDGNIETLEGNWVPAKNQLGNCGFGVTTLSKRTLVNSGFSMKPKKKIESVASENVVVNTIPVKRDQPKSKLVSSKNNSSNNTNSQNQTSTSATTTLSTSSSITSTTKTSDVNDPRLESRRSSVLKTIEVDNNSVKVDLYDNGYVDGDSISLFFNNKLLLSGKQLTENAISMVLKIEDTDNYNELVMYAENLGSIAPNTALMVVTDGPKRYEVRITSDLEKSGVIRFIKRK